MWSLDDAVECMKAIIMEIGCNKVFSATKEKVGIKLQRNAHP